MEFVSTLGFSPAQAVSSRRMKSGTSEARGVHSRRVRLFLSQATLEEWVVADKADVKEHHLVMHGEAPRSSRWKTPCTSLGW